MAKVHDITLTLSATFTHVDVINIMHTHCVSKNDTMVEWCYFEVHQPFSAEMLRRKHANLSPYLTNASMLPEET